MQIWKYRLIGPGSRSVVEMPVGAEVLSVGLQRHDYSLMDALYVWAKVDTAAELEKRVFALVGTGNLLPDDLGRFIGRVTMGSFEWHVFEVLEEEAGE